MLREMPHEAKRHHMFVISVAIHDGVALANALEIQVNKNSTPYTASVDQCNRCMGPVPIIDDDGHSIKPQWLADKDEDTFTVSASCTPGPRKAQYLRRFGQRRQGIIRRSSWLARNVAAAIVTVHSCLFDVRTGMMMKTQDWI